MANLSWNIGRVKITRVVETETVMGPDGLIPEATADKLEPHRSWMFPDFMTSSGYLKLSIHALAIESRGKRIVVDTCVGEHDLSAAGIEPSTGNFLSDLSEAGFTRDNVDYVLCTHMHFDHVGWNTMLRNGKWVPTFPNARYLFAEKEWEHFSNTSDLGFASTFADAVLPIVDNGLADFVNMTHEITDEVRLRPAIGHTPGHVCVVISSNGEEGLITGDATHNPVQWAEPSWKVLADGDDEEAARTRRKLASEYADSGKLVIGTHYSSPTAGYIKKNDKGLFFEGLKKSEE